MRDEYTSEQPPTGDLSAWVYIKQNPRLLFTLPIGFALTAVGVWRLFTG